MTSGADELAELAELLGGIVVPEDRDLVTVDALHQLIDSELTGSELTGGAELIDVPKVPRPRRR